MAESAVERNQTSTRVWRWRVVELCVVVSVGLLAILLGPVFFTNNPPTVDLQVTHVDANSPVNGTFTLPFPNDGSALKFEIMTAPGDIETAPKDLSVSINVRRDGKTFPSFRADEQHCRHSCTMTIEKPGRYVIRAQADDDGAPVFGFFPKAIEESQTLNITAIPLRVTLAHPTEAHVGSEVTVVASVDGLDGLAKSADYAWTLGGAPQPEATGPRFAFVPQAVGKMTVAVTASAPGRETARVAGTTTVAPAPTVQASPAKNAAGELVIKGASVSLSEDIVTYGKPLIIEVQKLIVNGKTIRAFPAASRPTAGRNGRPGGTGASGPTGSGRPGSNGGAGGNGQSGKDGALPGPIRITIGEIDGHLAIDNSGLAGANGGDGGAGGRGGAGGSGPSARDGLFNCKAGPGNGGNGGRGGNGGAAGAGGNGGSAGVVTITIAKPLGRGDLVRVDALGGPNGVAGRPGPPGRGGVGGARGSTSRFCGSGGRGPGRPGASGRLGITAAAGTPGKDGAISVAVAGETYQATGRLTVADPASSGSRD